MMENVSSNENTPSGARGGMNEVTLYRHRVRPDWGIAYQAWQRERKQCMVFEDGTRRVFARSHSDLFVPVGTGLRPRRPQQTARESGRSKVGSRLTLAGQMAHFERTYPGGFTGSRWIERNRVRPGRQLKRHLDAALERARTGLGHEMLEALRADGDYAAIRDAVVEVLAGTDLVRPARLRPLRESAPGSAFADGLIQHLHGTASERERFDAWRLALASLDVPLDWTLATAPRALLDPTAHVPVRPSVSDVQARMLLPTASASRSPDPQRYERHRMVADRVRAELEACGHPPRDLLDVHAFMWETLRPSARAETARLSQSH